jgi:ATP-binding cassette, subfamily B, bacterial PglK
VIGPSRAPSVGSVRRAIEFLTPEERRNGAFVLVLMLALALFEVLGVASVMPFLAVVGNPDLIETNSVLRWMYEVGGFGSVHQFQSMLGLGAFGLVVLSAGLRIATTYATGRWADMRRYSLSVRLLAKYLRQPYPFFLQRNPADLSKSLLSEVDAVVNYALKPAMELVAYGLVALVLLFLLMVADPALALLVGAVVGGFYSLVYLAIRGRLRRIGEERVRAGTQRFQTAAEAFGGIKDLKVMGREESYLHRFRPPAALDARNRYVQRTLAEVPKYVIEAVGFGAILVLTLVLLERRADLGEVLPILGLYAVAGYRLLPAVQRIYQSANSLRFAGPAVDAIYDDLVADCGHSSGESPHSSGGDRTDQEFLGTSVPQVAIGFDDVSFCYAGSEGFALRHVDVTIPVGSSVGFVGSTGAGKTTAVDLLLGLLTPTQGAITVDGVPLSDHRIPKWQKVIGYVPQAIYLADASIRDNIAFGIPGERVDHEAVERAARIARIHEFITEELPAGYDTYVGDRGVRLSGGQRQRIGIARALYHDPPVLVLDEATSALDTATEREIMEAVDGLRGQKTMVLIAHRLSTVEGCDQIVVLDRGRVAAVGGFDDLKRTSSAFRRIAVA